MDNRQATKLDRHNNNITACKILKVQGNTITIPLPWGGTTALMIVSDTFEVGDWVDMQLVPRKNNGRVTSYSAGYIGRTPDKFIPADDNALFATA